MPNTTLGEEERFNLPPVEESEEPKDEELNDDSLPNE